MLTKVAIIAVIISCAIVLWRIQNSKKSKSFFDGIGFARTVGTQDYKLTEISEGENKYFEPDCGENWIEIQTTGNRARYGNAYCDLHYTDCMYRTGPCKRDAWTDSSDVTEKLIRDCNHKTTCKIPVNYNQFGDPSRFCPKKLQVTWRCIDSPATIERKKREKEEKARLLAEAKAEADRKAAEARKAAQEAEQARLAKQAEQQRQSKIAQDNALMVRMFDYIDTNEDNFITIQEIKEYSRLSGVTDASELQQAVDYMMTCDKNGDTKISRDEYSGINTDFKCT